MRVGDYVSYIQTPKFQWIDPTSSAATSKDGSAVKVGNKNLNPPCSRIHHASCVLGQNVYLFGGKERYTPLKDLWKFDLENEQWQLLEFKETKIPHLQGHSMLSFRSQIFIYGGSFGESPDDIPLWIFSPDLGIVRKFTCHSSKPRPVGRRNHSAVIYKNSMYIFGGFQDSKGSSDELWSFNLEEEVWQRLSRPKDGKRHGHAAVVHCNAMWVHGGLQDLNCLSDLWVYNFNMCTWTKMKVNGKSPTLAFHTAHAFENRIILIGGVFKSTPSSSIFLYSICSKTWQQIDPDQNHLFTPVFKHTSVLIDPNLIIAGAKDINCLSTPHLKSESKVCVPIAARPWTSPNLDDNEISENTTVTQNSAAKVNVLNLESEDERTLLLSTDNNNNDSEENISSFIELQKYSDPKAILTTPLSQSNTVLTNDMETFEMKTISKSSDVTADPIALRRASREQCGDALPLLQTFSSTDSDLEIGEFNHQVTLSDENIATHAYSSNSSTVLSNRDSFQYMNRAFSTSSSSNDSIDILSKHCDFMQLSNKQVVLDRNWSQNLTNRYLQISKENCLVDEKFEENSSNNKTNKFSAISHEHFHTLIKELDAINTETIKEFEDMVLEDVESNAEDNELNDLKLAADTSSHFPSIRSSSLKNLSLIKSNSLETNLEIHHPNYIDSPKKTLSKSWGSLSSLSQKYDSPNKFLSFLIEKGRSSSISTLFPTQKSGKYVKHQNGHPYKDGLSADIKRMRNQSSLYKMIQSKKASSSQMSQLQIYENHFNHNTTAGNRHSSKTKTTSNGSIGFKLVLYIFGGETETPAFSKTPIHIKKCKIF